MGPIIVIIANFVFPKPALPDRAFSFLLFRCVYPGLSVKKRFRAFGKSRLDQTPAFGEIVVTFRQGPDTMQVIRQQYPGIDGKGVMLPHVFNR